MLNWEDFGQPSNHILLGCAPLDLRMQKSCISVVTKHQNDLAHVSASLNPHQLSAAKDHHETHVTSKKWLIPQQVVNVKVLALNFKVLMPFVQPVPCRRCACAIRSPDGRVVLW